MTVLIIAALWVLTIALLAAEHMTTMRAHIDTQIAGVHRADFDRWDQEMEK